MGINEILILAYIMPKNFSAIPVEQLSAVDILSIPKNCPELLFSAEEEAIRQRYREFAKKWHPDRCTGANADYAQDVFTRLTALKDSAEEKLANGKWETPGEVVFNDIAGKSAKLHFVKKHNFELGEMYVSQNTVTFAVKKEFKDLFENAQRAIKGIRYANDKMREEFERYVPKVEHILETPDRLVMMVKKDPNQVLLADYQENMGGKIEPKHAVWVGSRMHNLACFLEYNNLAHNAISDKTFFVGLEEHTGALLGGWFYAAEAGKPLQGLPKQTVEVVPPGILRKGKADTRVDLMLIRSAGRNMLGDKTGMSLTRDPSLPADLTSFLTLPPMDDARADFKAWGEVLKKSFGPRRFVDVGRGFNDVYQR